MSSKIDVPIPIRRLERSGLECALVSDRLPTGAASISNGASCRDCCGGHNVRGVALLFATHLFESATHFAHDRSVFDHWHYRCLRRFLVGT